MKSGVKLRGVNLGGWLIVEKWMTPSLFAETDAIDEYSLSLTEEGQKRIRNHRATFIAESDFAWLRDNGINAVRIPVGYWILQGDAPYIEGKSHLDWAIEMCEKYGLYVIIDVHGLNGSQNGRDHSGRKGVSSWLRHKTLRSDSISALEAIARRYRDSSKLWGFQIINEPRLGLFQFTLRAFYRQAYERVNTILRDDTAIIYSDAFTPRLLSGALKQKHGVVMDVHAYHMATPLANYMSIEFYFRKLKRRGRMLHRLSKTQPIIIGEWSSVLSHEVLRDVPKNKRTELTRRHTDIQLEIFEPLAGWFYWSYKTESSDRWNFRSQVESGMIRVQS